MLPTYASAAVVTPIDPRASDYLSSYNTYICPMGSGKIEVWFTVTGTDYMDDIGTLTIKLYESTDQETWTWIDTFRQEDYSNMLGHDKFYYSSHVDYQGVAGRYYKAYVTIWAGRDVGGDSRYMWTSVKQAT